MDTTIYSRASTLGASVPTDEHVPAVYGGRPHKGQDIRNTVFDSAEEAIEAVRAACCKDGKRYATSHDNGENNHTWTWGYNTHDALKLAARGWSEGAKCVGEPIRTANAFLQEQTEQACHYDVTGGAVDVAAYLSGVPECMLTFTEEKRETRAVRLVVNGFMSGGTPADLFFERGKAIMSAILGLQASGVAVSVDMIFRCRAEDGQGMWTYRLYKAGENFDASRLMFYLAHPAFGRIFGFGAMGVVLGSNCYYSDLGLPDAPRGSVNVDGLKLGHPWGDEAANRELMQACLDAAV